MIIALSGVWYNKFPAVTINKSQNHHGINLTLYMHDSTFKVVKFVLKFVLYFHHIHVVIRALDTIIILDTKIILAE